MKKTKQLSLAIAATLSLAATGTSNAQGFNFFDYLGEKLGNSSRSQPTNQYQYKSPKQNRSASLDWTIFALDNQSHQMYNNYGWEVRQHPNCPKVKALHNQMRAHMGTCDTLIKASKGTCPKTFKKASITTRDSAIRMTRLSEVATVSNHTKNMITQTNGYAQTVFNNSAQFRPVLPAPTYDPVYQKITSNVRVLPTMSNQMVNLYSSEAHSGCRDSRALLANLRKYNTNIYALDRAYKGTCPKTFKKAACDARDTLTVVQGLRKNLTVSPRVCSLISQSCPQLSYVHKNSSHFQPYQVVNTGSCQVRTTTSPSPWARGGRGGSNYTQTGW